MNRPKKSLRFSLIISLLIILALACGIDTGGDSNGGDDGPSDRELTSEAEAEDLRDTQEALSKTQNALNNPTQAPPTNIPPPTQALPTQALPTQGQVVPTNTVMPTPVPNTIEVGDVLYGTDFDSDDASNEDWGYFVIGGGDYNAQFAGSKLRLTAETPYTYLYVIYGGWYFEEPFYNVVIEARVEKVGGPNRNNIALVCRYNELGWYEFAITAGGLWEAYRYDVSSESYTALGNGGSTAIKTQLNANDLTLVCYNNTFTLFANNVEVGQVTDSRYSEGYAGVSVSSFDLPGVIVEIDWFVVYWAGY